MRIYLFKTNLITDLQQGLTLALAHFSRANVFSFSANEKSWKSNYICPMGKFNCSSLKWRKSIKDFCFQCNFNLFGQLMMNKKKISLFARLGNQVKPLPLHKKRQQEGLLDQHYKWGLCTSHGTFITRGKIICVKNSCVQSCLI